MIVGYFASLGVCFRLWTLFVGDRIRCRSLSLSKQDKPFCKNIWSENVATAPGRSRPGAREGPGRGRNYATVAPL